MKTNSKYAQHILDTGHSYGPIQDTKKVLDFATKGALEKFRIYNISKTEDWNLSNNFVVHINM
jgi:hypothetical protein